MTEIFIYLAVWGKEAFYEKCGGKVTTVGEREKEGIRTLIRSMYKRGMRKWVYPLESPRLQGSERLLGANRMTLAEIFNKGKIQPIETTSSR